MAHVQLHLLGPPEIRLDDVPVTGFASDKVRALLCYLTVEHDRPHRRESLAGLLWPDYPERSARTNLSNALSNLRTALGDREADISCFSVSREAIQFNDDSNHWVDANAFAAFVERGEWGQAAALYRGPFLDGFSLPDSPPFEQWTLVTRERLQRQAIEALGHLTAQYEQEGNLAQAIATARRQLAIEPWHEEGQRALMRLLALDGQRSAALAQYEACVRALEEELGAAPSPETTALYERIRAGEDLTGFSKPVRSVPSNLPAQLTPFVGREDLLSQIETRLQGPACRMLTLIGPGGAGKTRLALEAARRQRGAYRDGVYVAFLGQLQSVEAIVPTIVQALGLPLQSGDPRQQLVGYLREKEMLLVLDNYEHLLDGAALVTDMLQAAAGLQVIATSRARLGLTGEHLLHLGGMDLPPADLAEPEHATKYSAVQLYLQGARRVEPSFALRDDTVADVIHLCHLVEGIPLALLLAAAWVRALSPAEIADEVERGIDLLASEGRDMPERQRSMRAVFDHSWRLLDAHQQQVLAALSVFRGGCTREAAQEITGASLRDLMALVDRSLLEHTSSGRYEMHELLRQYAEERLAGSPEYAEVHHRHATYYARVLERAYKRYEKRRQPIELSQIAADIDNARAAWDWAVAHKRVTDLERAIKGLWMFYRLRVRYREGESACRHAAEALEGQPSVQGTRVRAVALTRRASFLVSLGEGSGARSCYQQGLALLHQLASMGENTRSEEAFALVDQTYKVMYQDLSEAERLADRALWLYRELGDRRGEGDALHALGMCAAHAGHHRRAKEYYGAAAARYERMHHQWDLADTQLMLAWVNLALGELDQAERRAQALIAFLQESETPFYLWGARLVLANVRTSRGQFAEASEQAQAAVSHFREMGDQPMAIIATSSLRGVRLHLGQYQDVEKLIRTIRASAEKAGHRSDYGESLLLKGAVALAAGHYNQATQQLEESLDAYQGWGREPTSHVLAALGCAAIGRGDLDRARTHLREATHTAVMSEEFLGKLHLLPAMALYLVAQGETARAVELHALATRHPYVAHSRWFEDVAGRQIEAAAADLPQEVVAAARVRGQARDLDQTLQELLLELQESADEQPGF
jgi:predicted ATPase/DNA-binding SARP family transcriptional activator